MNEKRVNLYRRLPEIYRIKDQEQEPPGQLKEYLGLVEDIFDKIHFDITNLYHNLFIHTCDNWAIDYIGDLLGRSHLAGDPWTLRADVADTVLLRKYKGTMLAIERLTYDLTQWGVHCVELRENLLWHQHLNHLRPDIPFKGNGSTTTPANGPVRGGIVNLRDPALLSLIKSPFDQFAYSPDFKADTFGAIRYNLPNLAIFLWTLAAYQVKASKPSQLIGTTNPNPSLPPDASFIVRVNVNPTGEPIVLFNTHRFNFESREATLPIESVTEVDKTPNPIPRARLCQDSPAGNPFEYVSLNSYDPLKEPIDISRTGLQLHFPVSDFGTDDDFIKWSIRGENLCAWEEGIVPPLKKNEVAIDPKIARILIGIDTIDRQQAIIRDLLISFTYGAVGPVGSHPVSRSQLPAEWRMPGQSIVDFREVFKTAPNILGEFSSLELALNNIQDSQKPIVVEIKDSKTYTLDITQIQGTKVEGGVHSLCLNNKLIVRASDGQRPVIKLVNPLRFRPTNVKGNSTPQQEIFIVILEGLYITRDTNFPDGEALISRAAINSLEIVGCTLDPGGHTMLNGDRAPSLELKIPFGFSDPILGPAEEKAFSQDQSPTVLLDRTISGPIFMDKDYQLLKLVNSIIDAGSGVKADPILAKFAVSGSSLDPSTSWSAPIEVHGVTIFGRMRSQKVKEISTGGIWVHTLEIQDNQTGCIKFSYFSGFDDRLPMNFGCVSGSDTKLLFESEIFWNPSYGQLSRVADFRILERGPNDDSMGAFGFLFEAHKWRNLSVRYREFMPVGLRPVIIKVT